MNLLVSSNLQLATSDLKNAMNLVESGNITSSQKEIANAIQHLTVVLQLIKYYEVNRLNPSNATKYVLTEYLGVTLINSYYPLVNRSA
jgi:hypothetical protein